jgi:hypothetical protein
MLCVTGLPPMQLHLHHRAGTPSHPQAAVGLLRQCPTASEWTFPAFVLQLCCPPLLCCTPSCVRGIMGRLALCSVVSCGLLRPRCNRCPLVQAKSLWLPVSLLRHSVEGSRCERL